LPGSFIRGLGLALLTAATLFAEGPAAAEVPAAGAEPERAALRLRYGAVIRNGGQKDPGPGLSYSGVTPNDFGLEGWYFPLSFLGASLSAQREGFSLTAPEWPLTTGSLLRVHLGPTVRFSLGRLRLELLAAYQFAQLPAFGSSLTPSFEPGWRQALLGSGRLMLDLGVLSVEIRGELPVSLFAQGPGGTQAQSTGFGAQATLRVPIYASERVEYAALLDGQLLSDSLSWTPADRPGELSTSTQEITRLGLAFQLRWVNAEPIGAPRFGSLAGWVSDLATGLPVSGAKVELEIGGQRQMITVGADGRWAIEQLEPGEVIARATAEGYLPGEDRQQITAGVQGSLALKLKIQPPQLGGVAISIIDRESGAPLPAMISVRDSEYAASDAGTLNLVQLPSGPMEIKVTAPGYRSTSEVASVVAGITSAVAIAMTREAKRVPATLSGRVRSTVGGKPIQADLELPKLKIKTRANAEGSFSFRVEGGVYLVKISAPGYLSQSKSVTVKDGDQAIFNVDLHAK
jgi:hypothetical protein